MLMAKEYIKDTGTCPEAGRSQDMQRTHPTCHQRSLDIAILQYCNIEISSFAAGSWIRWKIYDPWTNVSYEKANKKVFSLFCGICSCSCINATTIPSFLIPTRTRIHQEKKSQTPTPEFPLPCGNIKYQIWNPKHKNKIPNSKTIGPPAKRLCFFI